MNELSSLGLILLLALASGHLVKYIKVPEVTGYILAGVVLGPSMLGWVSMQNLAALEILSEVALGLILFSVGTVFDASRFRRVGPDDGQRSQPGTEGQDAPLVPKEDAEIGRAHV